MKVILVGKGGGWREAPLTHHTWGTNDLVCMRDVSLVFQMHDWASEKCSGIFAAMMETANLKHTPVIAREKPEGLRRDLFIQYPLEEIIEFFKTDLFGSTFDYMMAFAIFKQAEEIGIHGFTMSRQKEYDQQIRTANFWIGTAMARGIRTRIAGKSHLMTSHNGTLYGTDIKQNDSLRR